jgi:uncharacterized membrane protein
MRALLLILILAVVALIAAIATGWLKIDQTEPARAPNIEADGGGVSARGGQVPTFDIETGSVSVGARERNVTVPVPTIEVTPADQQPASENAAEGQPQPQDQ